MDAGDEAPLRDTVMTGVDRSVRQIPPRGSGGYAGALRRHRRARTRARKRVRVAGADRCCRCASVVAQSRRASVPFLRAPMWRPAATHAATSSPRALRNCPRDGRRVREGRDVERREQV